MTVGDLARPAHSDISTLKVMAKEIILASSLSGEDEVQSENAPRKPRPSGWYRPHLKALKTASSGLPLECAGGSS